MADAMNSLIDSSPELDLVFALVQFDPSQDQHIRDLLHGSLDWEEVLQIAINHEILPFVYKKLSAYPNDADPEGFKKLRKVFLETITRNIFLTETLLQVLELFSGEQIPVIALKGPAFAKLAYDDLAMRQLSDLDVLIHIQDFERAYQVLVSSNWTPEIPLKPGVEKRLLKSAYDLPFHKNGKYLELHWNIVEPRFTQAIDGLDWWNGVQTVNLLDREIPTLSAENTFLSLYLHATKHGWYKLKFILDLGQYISACPTLDWPTIVDQAQKAGLVRSLALAIHLVEKYCSPGLPHSVRQSCPLDQATLRLAINVEKNLLTSKPTITDIQSITSMIRSRERFRDRLYLMLDRIFIPKQTDWLLLSLPTALEPLYYVVRPARLLLKYGREFLIRNPRHPRQDR